MVCLSKNLFSYMFRSNTASSVVLFGIDIQYYSMLSRIANRDGWDAIFLAHLGFVGSSLILETGSPL